jgi:hypothetical protein
VRRARLRRGARGRPGGGRAGRREVLAPPRGPGPRYGGQRRHHQVRQPCPEPAERSGPAGRRGAIRGSGRTDLGTAVPAVASCIPQPFCPESTLACKFPAGGKIKPADEGKNAGFTRRTRLPPRPPRASSCRPGPHRSGPPPESMAHWVA